jgi:hypothetical protein
MCDFRVVQPRCWKYMSSKQVGGHAASQVACTHSCIAREHAGAVWQPNIGSNYCCLRHTSRAYCYFRHP